MAVEIADINQIFCNRARVLNYSKASEYKKAYRIIDNKVGNDHRS
jgi:hypothetical protein